MIEYRLDWPNYRPFPYERDLARSELVALTGGAAEISGRQLRLRTDNPVADSVLRRVAFTSRVHLDGGARETHISKLERSGLLARFGTDDGSRKESNYLTHGIHRYKGKFYPQLARALLNISKARAGDLVLDPFMGSGTTLLEAWLMGLDSIGFDINPLARMVARTKVQTLCAGFARIRAAVTAFERVARSEAAAVGVKWVGPGAAEEQGPCRLTARDLAKAVRRPGAETELGNWFPAPVVEKLVVIVRALASVGDPVAVDFIRVCLSDIIRSVSQQEPRDLRIRRRAEPIQDAPVFTALFEKLELELSKIDAGSDLLPGAGGGPRSWAEHADIRRLQREKHEVLLGREVDAVVSSPPYATALPYVDTDRLSFLVLGLTSPKERNHLQKELIGTREIADRQRRELEHEMGEGGGLASLPRDVALDLSHALRANSEHDVGFRRRNTPALLYQYFRDMREAMRRVAEVCRAGAPVFLVLGDSKTTLGTGEVFPIRTCDHVAAVCEQVGLVQDARIPITVTTEDLAHAKNAITENQILVLRRASTS